MVLIFEPEEKAEKIKKVLEKIKGWLKEKGKVVKEEKWGKRKLAYPLKTKKGKKLQEGEYFQIDFEAEPELVADIEKKFKLEEKVVRYLITLRE